MLTNIVYLSAVLANVMAPIESWDCVFPECTAGGDVLEITSFRFKRTTTREIVGFDVYEAPLCETNGYCHAVFGMRTRVSLELSNAGLVPPPSDECDEFDLN